MRKTLEIIVSGRVQGVGYRYFVREEAKQAGLTGWVRNLHDGSVMVLASGEEPAMERFICSLRIGPGFAHVTDLQINDKVEPFDGWGFKIIL